MNNNNKNPKDMMPKQQGGYNDGAGKEMEKKQTSPESKQSGSKQAGTGSWQSPEKGKSEGDRKKMDSECADKMCK